MKVLETERLILRRLCEEDAAFLLELVNDPAFIANIGDRGVRTLADARRYLENGPLASYQKHGFGLFLVEQKESGTPVGICGLLKRETLDDVDLGYAFLPQFRLKGYASESAAGVLVYGREKHGLSRIVAIVAPHNDASVRVLTRLGFQYERMADAGTRLYAHQSPGQGPVD